MQQECLDAILLHKKGTIILPTGFGKTRVGSLLAQARPGKTLVLTSKTTIVRQWSKQVPSARVLTYNSGYKLLEKVDVLILDEGHRATSACFSRVFENIECEYLLVLTATLPKDPERRAVIERYAPVIKEVGMEEAMEKEAIAEVDVINVGMQKLGEGGRKYKIFDAKLKEAAVKLSVLAKKDLNCLRYNLRTPFDVAKRFHLEKGDSDLIKYSKQFWGAMSMRRQVLYANEEKIPVMLKIMKMFPNRKWIIFFKSISMATKANKLLPGSALYHSKVSSKERKEVLDRVASGRTNILIGVSALNEGLDLPELDTAICVAGVSTPLEFIQQVGRVARKTTPDKRGLMFNLYVKDTAEERWIKEKSSNFKTTFVDVDELENSAVRRLQG